MYFRALSLLILYFSFFQTLMAQQKAFSILFLGDSYTIGEGVTESQNYPNQLVSVLKSNGFQIKTHKIVAKTGWTSGELVEYLLNDEDYYKYDLVFLCIGVNNQYRGLDINVFKKELTTLINYSIIFSGNKSENVILLTIPDYGFTPFGISKKETISKEINFYNSHIEESANASNCGFINITESSRNNNKEMLTSDDLHPSALQYKLWVDRIFEMAKTKLLKLN